MGVRGGFNLCVVQTGVEREEPVGVTTDNCVVADDWEAQHCRPEGWVKGGSKAIQGWVKGGSRVSQG